MATEVRAPLGRSTIALLAGLGALGSMAIHMLVPALPAMARDLQTAPDTVQLTVTLYLVGLGAGQLVAGPASDRIGRRPVLLAGMAIFVAGALGCGIAQGAAALIAARVLQALGAAAALVAVRAIVADRSSGATAAANMGALMSVVLLSPAVSPLVGGALAHAAGWRAVFGLLAAAGVLGWLLCLFRLGEASAPARTRSAGMRRSYAALARNPRFPRYVAAIAASSCGLYIFLGGSAFLLIERYGLGPAEAGLCYSLVAGAGIAGALSVGRLERRGGAFRIGLASALTGGAAMLALALIGADGPAALVAPMLLVGAGAGIAGPAGVTGAMHAEPALAGTAASLTGALQMVASGITTSLVAQLHVETIGGIAFGICVAAGVALALAPAGRAVVAPQ